MIQKIKKFILLSASALMLSAPGLVPAVAGAAATTCGAIGNQVADGADAAVPGTSTTDCSQNLTDSSTGTVGKLAKTVVNIFSYIVGAVAVVMIIYGGFRYVTSGGDSNGVGAAKNTLIYAIVGLIIVALAQIIVRFVLTGASSA